MKKILCMFLTVLMLFSLISCTVEPVDTVDTVEPVDTIDTVIETPITDILNKIEYTIYSGSMDSVETEGEATIYGYQNYYDEFFYVTFDFFPEPLPDHTKTIEWFGEELELKYVCSSEITNFNLKPLGVFHDTYQTTIDGHRVEFTFIRETSELLSYYDIDSKKFDNSKKTKITKEEAEKKAIELIEQCFGENVLEGCTSKIVYSGLYQEKDKIRVSFSRVYSGIESLFHYSVTFDRYGNLHSISSPMHPDPKECEDRLTEPYINAAKEKLFSSIPEGFTQYGEPLLCRDFVTGKCYLYYSFKKESMVRDWAINIF